MRAVMPMLGSGRHPLSHAVIGINELIGECLQEKDTQRPTSVVIIDGLRRFNVLKRPTSMIREIAYQHLSPHLGESFWSHETECPLCRRLLQGGGVSYVEEFDRVRAHCCQIHGRDERLPAMPRSMSMKGLSTV
jgi:hypothetical protein